MTPPIAGAVIEARSEKLERFPSVRSFGEEEVIQGGALHRSRGADPNPVRTREIGRAHV